MSRIAKPRRGKKKNAEAAAAAEAAITGDASPGAGSSRLQLSDFALQPVSAVRPQPRKPGTIKFPKAIRYPVVLGVGRSENFVQRPGLPESVVPGASALMTLLSGPGSTSKLRLDNSTRNLVTPVELDDAFYAEIGVRDPNRHRIRRAKQSVTWQTVVVPLLVRTLLNAAQASLEGEQVHVCTCSAVRTTSVLLCELDGISQISFEVCACRPAARRLVADGYFPCAPTRPSVAFSLRLLELISIHSLNVAPNVTAWASTLEAFWNRRGFTVAEKRIFRTRLGNALHWYQVVINERDAVVSRAIHVTRQQASRKRKSEETEDTALASPPKKRVRFLLPYVDQDGEHDGGSDGILFNAASQVRMSVVAPGLDDADCTDAASIDGEPDGPAATHTEYDSRRRPVDGRPAEYLRQRCPLCFGGSRPVLELSASHVIVCLDANFSQKRRRSDYTDPAVLYADSCFVDPHDVERMEKEVGEKRTTVNRKRKKGTSAKLHDDVLDECEKSFIAAQETVTKASKNYYSDTGLMAILCRHDQALYVVNMSTPGERQHYALALLREVFNGLPPDWSVGVLYDIACQLSRSIEKHNFLPEFADRMAFAVSVFHAYGHQWACQLVFHPRKRDGFGLTDGEGCERFWSALRGLIACLRVSGYHRRLFILDRQIEYIETQNLYKMGKWLARRWSEATRRLYDAALRLELISVSDEELALQWKAQVESQLARAPRQSKYAGEKAIDSILLDLALLEDLGQEYRSARAGLKAKAHILPAREVQGLKDKVDGTRAETKRVRERIAVAKAQLGTGALRAFEELRGDAYIRARVNARALRVNIRMAVRAHKFEREKLERNYRRQVMQNKDHAQTRDLVHSREKNISAMVRKFNMVVTQMEELLKNARGARRHTKPPRRLDAKKLFRLDVDDDIWQEDPGLGPQDEGDLPRWQIDADVREGIILMQERKRCQEELERVSAESHALLQWWLDEREILRDFCDSADVLMRPAGELQLVRLEQYALTWNSELARTELGVVFPVSSTGDGDAWHANYANGVNSTKNRNRANSEHGATGEGIDGDADDAAVVAGQELAHAMQSGEAMSDSESDTYTEASSAEDSPDEDDPDAVLLDLVAAHADSAEDSEIEGVNRAGREVVSANAGEDTDSEQEELDTVLASQPSPPSPAKSAQLPRPHEGSAQQPIDVDSLGPDLISTSRSLPRDKVVDSERGRACGPYACLGEDVTRMAQRTTWLSGQGLAVFAEAKRVAVGNNSVGHLPSTLFLDVHEYRRAKEAGDKKGMATQKNYIAAKLAHVPTPSTATKWLVVAHILEPEHWTLLEIRWSTKELRFYDSLAAQGSYDVRVKALAFELLAICKELYENVTDIAAWSWIGEKRPARQTNWYDCGPFVAADLVSLLSSDKPSTLAQENMRAWRKSMVEFMRQLDVAPVKEIVKRKK